MSNIQERGTASALKAFLGSPAVEAALAKVLPAGLTPARLVRQVLTLAQINPDLANCTQVSILGGLIQGAELGLQFAQSLGQAYLVPRYNSKKRVKEAVFQIGYRGMIQLAHRSGRVASLSTDVVCENDSFRMRRGTSASIEHEPALGVDRGKPIGYYAVAILVSGMPDFEFMTHAEMVAHRDKYAASDNDRAPWATSFDAMALKTVVRRLMKRLPMSVEEMRLFEVDGTTPTRFPALAASLPELPALLTESEPAVESEIQDETDASEAGA